MSDESFAGRDREPTGVTNLDEVLGGGLARGALVIVMGAPGSGKTTLANQIAFFAAARGQRALVLSALSEPTSKLIEHLHPYQFFRPELVGDRVQFMSLQNFLSEGLEKTGDEVIAAARTARADFVVLDGFRGMRGADVDQQRSRQFLYEVGTTLSLQGATTIITSEADPRDPDFFPEATTGDVILGLYYDLVNVRSRRGLEVIKVRGGAPLPGLHGIGLSNEGLIVYPRIEVRASSRSGLGTAGPSHGLTVAGTLDLGWARDIQTGQAQDASAAHSHTASPASQRLGFDLPELDVLLGGGVNRQTSTLLAGGLGVGKTLVALRFALAGVQAGEPALYVGFRETIEQLLERADAFALGPALRAGLKADGRLALLRWEPVELNPEIVAEQVLGAVDRLGARRLVVDSIAEWERAVVERSGIERVPNYMAALLAALRARGVTPIFIQEVSHAMGSELNFSTTPLAVLSENVVLLQQVTVRARLHHVLSVPKMRFSAHDHTLREYVIVAPEGIRVLAPAESAGAVLAGIAMDLGQSAAPFANDSPDPPDTRASRSRGRVGTTEGQS